MDVYMHGFPARLVFFIDMLIQVRMLQDIDMGSRDYITLKLKSSANAYKFKRKISAL